MTKKFSFLLLAALFIFSVESMGQVQVALGLKAGPNFAKIDVNSNVNTNYQNRTGWHGGAFLLFKFGKVGIQPEFLYSKQGSKFKVNTTNYQANFDYINIPVMIKLYTVLGINLQLGPQISFLSSAGGTAVDNAGQPTKASTDLFKSSDFSGAFGVGWDLPFGLTVDARYNHGFSKIQDSPTLDGTKNQVFMVSLGYKLLKFGKK